MAATLHPFYLQKIQRGCYMKGSIHADVRSGCSCGGSFSSRIDFDGYKIPICDKCKKYPPKFKVNRTLPGVGVKDIRYFNGERINSATAAIYCMKRLDEQITKGCFQIKEYMSKEDYECLRFGPFVANYLERCRVDGENNKRSPEGIRKDVGLAKNHLMPFFHNYYVTEIKRGSILDFERSMVCTEGVKKNALALLRTILRFAHAHEAIDSVPSFPRIGVSKHRKNSFIDRATQIRILGAIKNPKRRAAIEILCIFCIRPCELRALKWCDVDLKNHVLHIRRHFSGKKIMEGRKSQNIHGEYCELHLPFFEIPGLRNPLEIFFELNFTKDDDFIFKSESGNALPISDLYKHWIKAQKDLGLERIVDLYEGTKHAGASAMVQAGVPIETVREVLGHTEAKTTERYAKSTVESVKSCVNLALNKKEGGQILEFKKE